MEKIKDFGEKIGGARKDMYSTFNLDGLNAAELKAATRDKIWKKPNIVKLVAEGADKELLYWQEMIRKSLPQHPVIGYGEDEVETCRYFIEEVNSIKAWAEEQTVIDIPAYREFLMESFEPGAYGRSYSPATCGMKSVTTRAIFSPINTTESAITKKVSKENFGMSPEDKRHAEANGQFSICRYFAHKPDTAPERMTYFYPDPERQEPGVLALSARGSVYGTYFIHQKSKPELYEGWKDNTYVITDRRGYPIAKGFDTFEKAEEVRKAMVSVAEAALKSSRKKGKTKFTPPQLEHVEQSVGDIPLKLIRHITGDDYMNDFGFRAGEFGNWMSENDRQASLDMGYLALENLCQALGLASSSVSFNGRLAIAFGARGRSSARAHYEPMRDVINLTKMNGAGALAHEWGHALDAFIGSLAGISGLASSDYRFESSDRPQHDLLPEFVEIQKAMRYKTEEVENDAPEVLRRKEEQVGSFFAARRPAGMDDTQEAEWNRLVGDFIKAAETKEDPISGYNALNDIKKKLSGHIFRKEDRDTIYALEWELRTWSRKAAEGGYVTKKVETEYLTQSKEFGKYCQKDGGYWESREEMFARAFDCYVSDKLKELGIKDTYLSAFANAYVFPREDGSFIRAYPTGEERERLNRLFDDLISALTKRHALEAK